MALWPNARYMTRSTAKGFGRDVGLSMLNKNLGDRMNRFINESFARTAATPAGYDVMAFVPAIRAGGMAALRVIVATGGTANVLAGGPMEGTGAVTFSQSGGLSLTVALQGSDAVATLTGENMVLRLTVGLDGSGVFALTGTNNLALIVPFQGAGGVLTMGAGATDLRGLLALAGEWTPFAELSPEGLANAVWNGLATQYNEAGTMGAKLNTASSGGVDLNALAAAVHGYTVESGLTFEEVTRIIAAALAGTTEKAGSTITFKGLDGTTDRIVGSFDAENNRTGAVLDGS